MTDKQPEIVWRLADSYMEWVEALRPKRTTYLDNAQPMYEIGRPALPTDRPFVADVQTTTGVVRTVIQRNPALRIEPNYTTTVEVDGVYHYDAENVTFVREVDLT